MRRFFAYLCSALLLCGNASAYSGGYSAYELYQYASSGNFRVLRSEARNIDATDSNGKTAICYSIDNRDYVAYKNLVMLKADEHPDCVERMDKAAYADFKRGYELRGGKIASSSGIKGSTVAWTVAGLAAVGGGIAIAAGGGGGGGGGSSSSSSSDSTTPVTPAKSCESYNLNACLPNGVCEECVGATRSYFKLTGCKDGYIMNAYNTGCIPNSSIATEYPLLSCDPNGQCASAMAGDVRRYKLIRCNQGYEMDSSGMACVPICDGYTKTDCDFYTQYISEVCTRDASYHKCAARTVTDHCSDYKTNADECTACYGNYKLNDGVCEQICKGFTQVPCENNTQYTSEICSDNPNYHKCATRTNKNCSGFVTDKDECSSCDAGHILIDGACVTVCEGFTQDDCLENQYISAKCDADPSYHKCKDRTITDGCMQYETYEDKCVSCYPGYKFNDGVCDQICIGYTNKSCQKATQYISSVCADDSNFHICTERSNTDGCSDYEVDKDLCISCNGGYNLVDGECISACPGYTQAHCDTLEYKSEDCVNDPSFHLCKARKNTNACADFDPNADKCTACVDGYFLNNGVCQLLCPGYTKEDCNQSLEYEDEYCTKDNRYHTCTPRKNKIGCVEYSKTSDDCTVCDGTSTEPVAGKCECSGYITDACDKKTQYISAVCATAAGYHTCTEREHTEGCKTFDEYADKCTSCEKNTYYLPESGICTLRENTDYCKTYSETEDKCLTCAEEYKVVDGFCVHVCAGYVTEACDIETHYTVSDCVDESGKDVTLRKYHRCVERTNIDGCDTFNQTADTCKKCDDEHTLNGQGKCDTNSSLCPGYTQSECNTETQYMPIDTIDGQAPFCQYDSSYHRCIQREVTDCTTYNPNYDKCASCKDTETLVDGKCQKLCPGYQQEECNNKYYYTGATCADDASYHKCEFRNNTMYCTEFAPTKDECTDCKDGYKVENGSCTKICPGFTKEPCGSGMRQSSEVCTDPEGGDYHKCERSPDEKVIPGCKEYTSDNQKCKSCEDWYTLSSDGSSCILANSNSANCEKPVANRDCCTTCKSGYVVDNCSCVVDPNSQGGGGDNTPSGGDDSGGGGGGDSGGGGGGDDCQSKCSSKSYYKVKGSCSGDEGICTPRNNYPIAECDTYAEFSDSCEICENGYGVGDNTGNNGPNSSGLCPSQDGSDCVSSSCPSGQHSYTEGCSSGHRCMSNIANCSRYDSGDGLCDDCEDGYDLSSDRKSCTGSGGDSDCISTSCPSGQHSYTEGCSSGHKCMADISNCKRYDSQDGLCDSCEDGYDLSSDRTSCTSSGGGGGGGSDSDAIIAECDKNAMNWSKCTPRADCDLEKNYYESGSLHTCCTTKYSGSMTEPIYCQPRTNTYCGGNGGYHGYTVGSDTCASCASGTPNNGRCPGDPQYVAPSSGYTVVPHTVSEDKAKGMTVYTALDNKLDNFGDDIGKYNGYLSDIKQKIVLEGEFNNAVDITGSYNTDNGSDKGGHGAVEIVRFGESDTALKGAIKGLVGGNNHEGSEVIINLDVDDAAQNGKRSFIAGMGKEVGAYTTDKNEIYGIDLGSAEHGQHNAELQNAGSINIASGGTAPVFGILGLRHAGNVASHSENKDLGDFVNAKTGIIDINALNAAEVYGIRVNNIIGKDGTGKNRSVVTNDGIINVSGGSNVYGIAATNADIFNNGDINVSATGDYAYGIYADNSKVENNGNITIDANADNVYGIYAVNNSSVKNNGVININGAAYSENAADGKFIKVDKGSYIINANTIVANSSFDTRSLGGGDIVMTSGSNITAPEVSGKLTLSSDITTGSNNNVYTLQNMVSGNAQNLDVVSQSAMFKASTTTGDGTVDGTLTRSSFNELIKNSSLADYLDKNYEAGNATKLFDDLKNIQTLNKLKSGINDFFGQKMLPRMTFEDMSMMREINFDMNKNMFKQEGAFSFGGSVSPYSYDNNVGSIGRYALHGVNRGKNSYALGISISDVRTYDDNDENSRSDQSFVMSAPLGHKTHGIEFITTPKIGYSYGEYTRNGFNNSYKGKVYKRMYALMNEARYPISVGKMSFTPSAEFNMIGFNVKGSEEAHKPYNLRVPSQNHYSVEAGLGLMAEKEFSLYKHHKFKMNGGVAFYHEFANPYELDVSMSEMDGTYRLHDEKRHANRVAARVGFDYKLRNDVDVSMSMLSNIDGECRTDAVCDVKYHF